MRDDPLIQLIIVIAPLSLLAIGGASAIYAPLQQQTVDVYHWITGREYLELFAIARVTPGPGSMLTTLIGWKVAGFLGALVATLALYVPCSLLCFGVAHTWNRYRGTNWHTRDRERAAPDRRRADDRGRRDDPAHRRLGLARLGGRLRRARRDDLAAGGRTRCCCWRSAPRCSSRCAPSARIRAKARAHPGRKTLVCSAKREVRSTTSPSAPYCCEDFCTP